MGLLYRIINPLVFGPFESGSLLLTVEDVLIQQIKLNGLPGDTVNNWFILVTNQKGTLLKTKDSMGIIFRFSNDFGGKFTLSF